MKIKEFEQKVKVNKRKIRYQNMNPSERNQQTKNDVNRFKLNVINLLNKKGLTYNISNNEFLLQSKTASNLNNGIYDHFNNEEMQQPLSSQSNFRSSQKQLQINKSQSKLKNEKLWCVLNDLSKQQEMQRDIDEFQQQKQVKEMFKSGVMLQLQDLEKIKFKKKLDKLKEK